MLWLEIIIGILQNKGGKSRIRWLSNLEILAISPKAIRIERNRDFRELYRLFILAFPVRRD